MAVDRLRKNAKGQSIDSVQSLCRWLGWLGIYGVEVEEDIFWHICQT